MTEGTLTVNLVMTQADGTEMRRPPVSTDEGLSGPSHPGRIALMAVTAVTRHLRLFAWRLESGDDIAQIRSETFTLLAMAMCQ